MSQLPPQTPPQTRRTTSIEIVEEDGKKFARQVRANIVTRARLERQLESLKARIERFEKQKKDIEEALKEMPDESGDEERSGDETSGDGDTDRD